MERRRIIVGGVALAVLVTLVLAGAVVWMSRSVDGSQPAVAGPPSASARPEPGSPAPEPPSTAPSPTVTAKPACDEVRRSFAPTTITVPGVTAHAGVVTPPRDAYGLPGVPPLTDAGKTVFAWDREQGTRPGDARGNVLLNAHTWPDGTALGNWLLGGLHKGDRIVVHGPRSRLCYRVTERVQVPGDQPFFRYYAKKGPPQLAIVVCSGRRLAPGVWEKRTVWFASPSV